MFNVFIEYCRNSYNVITVNVSSFDELKNQLQRIKEENADFRINFSADVVIEDVSRISIGLL